MNFIKLTSFLLFLYIIGFVPNQTGAMVLKPTGLTNAKQIGKLLPKYITSRGQYDYRNTWQSEKENKQKFSIPQVSTTFKKYSGLNAAFTLGALGAGYYWYNNQQEQLKNDIIQKIKDHRIDYTGDLEKTTHYIKNHFVDLVTLDAKALFIKQILSEEQQVDCILKHINAIACHEKKDEIIFSFFSALAYNLNKATLQKVLKKCALDMYDPAILPMIYTYPNDQEIIHIIAQNPDRYRGNVFIMSTLAQSPDNRGLLSLLHNNHEKTQTEYHLEKLSKMRALLKKQGFSYFGPTHELAQNHHLIRMANSFNTKARELEYNGYTTFVHGQYWSHQLTCDLYTFLWQLHTKKPVQDFIFVHLKDPKSIENSAQEEKIHKTFIENGRTTSRDGLLFMNYALFANHTLHLSSSAFYIANNTNINATMNSLSDIFTYFDINNLYKKYEKEFVSLQNEHKKINSYGNCLLIAVPNSTLEQSVYAAKALGYKGPHSMSETLQILKKDEPLINMVSAAVHQNKQIDIDKEVEKALEHIQQIDKVEFCLPMTNSRYGGLNPESGIKIFSFNAVPQDKWKAYCTKRDALFAQIKADFQKEQRQ